MYRTAPQRPERPRNVRVERVFVAWALHVLIAAALAVGLVASLSSFFVGTSVVCTREGEPWCTIRDVSVIGPTIESRFRPSRSAVQIRKLGAGRNLAWGLSVGDGRLFRAGVTEAFGHEVVEGVGRFASSDERTWAARTSRAISVAALAIVALLIAAFVVRSPFFVVIRVDHDMQRVFVRVLRNLYSFSFDEIQTTAVKPARRGNGHELYVVKTNDERTFLFTGSESACTRAAAVLSSVKASRVST